MAHMVQIDSLEQTLAMYKDHDTAKIGLLIDLSFEYKDIDPPKCKEYAEHALELARKAGSKVKEAAAHNALGVYYYYLDMPYPAYVNYKKAENLLLKYGVWNDVKEIYYNLMHLYVFIQDDENAMLYANKLLDIASKDGDLSSEIGARYTLNSIRFRDRPGQEELDGYLDLYWKALPLDNNITHVVEVYCGDSYLHMGKYREGLSYLHRAREYFEAHEEAGFTMEAYIRLAEAYILMHQVDSAEWCLQKVAQSPIIYASTRMRILQSKSMLDSIRGNCWGALAHFKAYSHLADSLAKDKNTNEVARMKNWYEIEQKENENRILQQEQHKQSRLIYSLVGTLVLIIILIVLLAYLYRRSVKKNSELKELHKVKDKLFSVVAHDLRSPIGTLMTMLKLINENSMDAETQTELLKGISSRVDDTYGLLDNLLCWSKSQMQSIVPSATYFDIQTVSLIVTSNLQEVAIDKQINLRNLIEKHQVYADKEMFTVVIRNLTMNALKYTYAGGEVKLASKLSGDVLIVSVTDNGTGMTQDVQDKLFKLSETSSKRGTNNESGAGLGLVLCADFVKTNGGSIWFESQEGKGTTFFFSIPVKKLEE